MRLLVVLIVLGMALSPIALVVPVTGLGQQRSVYSTRAEAVADGAIERGWVPGFVPADATDIREAHNVEHWFVTVSFRAPARYGDELAVGVRVASIGTKSFVMEYRIARYGDDALIAEARSVLVRYDYAAERSVPVSEEFRAKVAAQNRRQGAAGW